MLAAAASRPMSWFPASAPRRGDVSAQAVSLGWGGTMRSGRDVGVPRDPLGFSLVALQSTCMWYGCATSAASPASLLLCLGVELKISVILLKFVSP